MKKMFLVVAVLFTGITATNAQTKFGIKTGVQIANLTGDDADDVSSKLGFNVGGYANIRLSEAFAFQPEVLFSLQGSKLDETYTDGTYTEVIDQKVNLNYINVPLMMKWYAYDGLNFEFGPQIGFNVTAKSKGDYSYSDGTESYSDSLDYDIEDTETIDFGLNIGAGYELNNGLNFGLRYGLGLTDVVKDSDVKNSVFSFGVGYTF
ncbi:MAG: porin family protein [Moheibacter sp.]